MDGLDINGGCGR